MYHPGLDIYIFGFSRGAFTARSLAGFIGASGLLRPENCNTANEHQAWEYYRTPPQFRYPADGQKMKALSFSNVRIKLLGVFDTVGARGIPITGVFSWYNRRNYGFHDVTLGTNVDHALHTLAIDEKRLYFPATLWQYPNHKDNFSVEQVWFPGNHSNVGGGYADTSLSSIALKWMLARIEDKKLGLRLVDRWQDRLTSNSLGSLDEINRCKFILSRMYPSRGIINQCPPRVRGRKVGLPPHAIPIGEMLHWTALHRREGRKLNYSPPNLESALSAMLSGQHLMPIVGKSEKPLQWFENTNELAELVALLPPKLGECFTEAAENLMRSDKPLSVQEEAKQQAAKEA